MVLPTGVTVIDAVVAVVLHTYAVPADAVNVALADGHTVAVAGEIVAVGVARVTLAEAVAVQPPLKVTVTV